MLSVMSGHETHIQTYRDWISQIMVQNDIPTVSRLARIAGLAESTLTRFMNPDGPGNVPREGTIAKIEQAFKTRRPSTNTDPGACGKRGANDPRFRAETVLDTLKQAVANDDAPIQAYLVGDRALDLAGYLQDDMILVDTSRQPEPQDVVAIRFLVGNVRSGTVMLRIYDAPFLTTHSSDESLRRPILIDPDRVEILGVVTTAFRQRQYS